MISSTRRADTTGRAVTTGRPVTRWGVVSPRGWLESLIASVRVPAWATGILALVRRRGAERMVARLLPTLLAELAEAGTGPLQPSQLRVLPSSSDVTVALLGDDGGRLVSVLKIPRSEQGRRDLHAQASVISALTEDERLGAWRELLPAYRVLGSAERMFVLEAPMHGVDASTLLTENPARLDAVVSVGLATIDDLHRRTACTLLIDDAVLDCWLGPPMALLSGVRPSSRLAPFQQLALDRLEARLRSAVAGRRQTVSWVHGDFVPGNVMLPANATRVTGVLDWAQARPDGLPALDDLLWIVSIVCRLRSRQLGQFVGDAIAWSTWPDDPVLSRARSSIEQSGLRPGDLLLWCWLLHVTGNLQKSARYSHHPLWWATNVDPVVEAMVS